MTGDTEPGRGRDALFGGALPGQDAMYSSAVGLIAARRRNIAAGSCLGRCEPAVKAFPGWAFAFEKVRPFEEFDFVRAAKSAIRTWCRTVGRGVRPDFELRLEAEGY